jgi:trehalose 6-phosphate synthase/phosphatase
MIDTIDVHASASITTETANDPVALQDNLRSRQFAEWTKKCASDNQLLPTDSVIIVHYFLPVKLSRTNGVWSANWDGENILALDLNMRTCWVGSVRYEDKEIPYEEQDAVTEVLLRMNCHPVFIPEAMHHQFYDQYCKHTLWPLMHHVVDIYGPLNTTDLNAKHQQDLWGTVNTVNTLIRKKVVENIHDNDMVWIHGFHLMHLPSLLRRGLIRTKIGFFLHTPFPSSEIWRTLSKRKDLVTGLLSADHIGFHLYEYARHFRSVCHRVLGFASKINAAGNLVVNVDGREVTITAMHIGVDSKRVQGILSQANFETDMNEWKSMFANKIVIAGIDRLERLKGIPLKLLAIEKFLVDHKEWMDKVIFVIIGITAKERGDDYLQTQRDIQYLVNRINSKNNCASGPAVVFHEYQEKDTLLPRRLAFLAAVDVFMSTATRDGLNRIPLEYVLAKQRAAQLKSETHLKGVVIVSEFVSSARIMRGAIIVNPWKVEEVSNAIAAALDMGPVEMQERAQRNLNFATRQTTTTWAQQVLLDLKSVVKADNEDSVAMGFGLGFRVVNVREGFHELNSDTVCRAYRDAKCRLIVLDWGGTLVIENDLVDKLSAYSMAKRQQSRSGLTSELSSTLVALCQDPQNVVFVVSGKMVHSIHEVFGEFPNLGLGAEHGFYYRWPKSMINRRSDAHGNRDSTGSLDVGVESDWHSIHSLGDVSWKKSVEHIMELYVQRTHGTYIEQKGSALIWQYRDADPEFGYMQSKELEEHLKLSVPGYSLEIIRGGGVSDGYIEVRPAGVSKGHFLRHIVAKMKKMHRSVDFILAIGDDISDEPMFEFVNNFVATTPTHASVAPAIVSQMGCLSIDSHDQPSRPPLGPPQHGQGKLAHSLLSPSHQLRPANGFFSVTVGKKSSVARSYVNDPNAVRDLLQMLVRQGHYLFRQSSQTDLLAGKPIHTVKLTAYFNIYLNIHVYYAERILR